MRRPTTPLTFAGLFTSLFAACAPAPSSSPSPTPGGSAPTGQAQAPVVYGEDDRREWYELEAGPLSETTRASSVALLGLGDVEVDEVGRVSVPMSPTLTDTYGLCADQRYRMQPTASFCSGTLIDDDLVLTAGHCVRNLSSCASNAYVFDYLYESDGVMAELKADSVYRCAALHVSPGNGMDADIDLAILQLDRPVVDRLPAEVSSRGLVSVGDTLTMQGFPNGIPLKVSTGIVKNVRNQGDYVTAAVDAFHGDSGAGLYDANLEIIGVLTDGAEDYVSAGSCAQTNVLDPDEAVESVYLAKTAVEALCAKGFPSPRLCKKDPSCGDGFCTGGETAETCEQDCRGLFAVPEGWTCSARWYAAGDDCDCECGVYDPDCDNAALRTTNCGVGGRCQADATCDVPIPETWTCDRTRYNNGQQCDCDCGAYDPDCDNPNARIVNCAPGGECQADGTCTASIPREWTCRARYYHADDGCDCNCGAYDPDCDDPRSAVYNCSPDSICLPDGSCEIPIPSEWACGAEHYAAGDACDCRCGMVDPDCGPDVAVSNCASGEFCGPDGACTAVSPWPEPEPEPSPEEVEVEAGPEPEPEVEVGPEPEPEPEPEPDVVEVEPTKGRDDGGCGGGASGGLVGGLGLTGLLLSGLRRRMVRS